MGRGGRGAKPGNPKGPRARAQFEEDGKRSDKEKRGPPARSPRSRPPGPGKLGGRRASRGTKGGGPTGDEGPSEDPPHGGRPGPKTRDFQQPGVNNAVFRYRDAAVPRRGSRSGENGKQTHRISMFRPGLDIRFQLAPGESNSAGGIPHRTRAGNLSRDRRRGPKWPGQPHRFRKQNWFNALLRERRWRARPPHKGRAGYFFPVPTRFQGKNWRRRKTISGRRGVPPQIRARCQGAKTVRTRRPPKHPGKFRGPQRHGELKNQRNFFPGIRWQRAKGASFDHGLGLECPGWGPRGAGPSLIRWQRGGGLAFSWGAADVCGEGTSRRNTEGRRWGGSVYASIVHGQEKGPVKSAPVSADVKSRGRRVNPGGHSPPPVHRPRDSFSLHGLS